MLPECAGMAYYYSTKLYFYCKNSTCGYGRYFIVLMAILLKSPKCKVRMTVDKQYLNVR